MLSHARSISSLALLLAASQGAAAQNGTALPVTLGPPTTLSTPHNATFASLSIEPAFWTEFFGTLDSPNELFLGLLSRFAERAGQAPNIRPGGITMDSLIFDANQTEDLVRSTNPATGAVYRTTVGPKYYQYWDKLPKGTQVVSTLNLGNLTYEVARDLALASLQYAPTERILGLELGNEPNSYWNTTGGNGGAQGYVNLWKNWTSMIDNEVNGYLGSKSASFPQRRWWASSATTDDTAVNLRPVSIIPDGVNSNGNIAEYSIHNYQWSTCDPNRTEIATIPNILNISAFGEYADTAIMPSGTAAVNAGNEWLIGEYNSISCSGRVNVTDTAAQALWHLITTLGYAARNASGTYLHQGGTLALQSSNQENSASTADGKPSFSAYDFVYPINTTARGEARANPGYLSLLLLAEAFGDNGAARVGEMSLPSGVDADRFQAFSFHDVNSTAVNATQPDRIVLLNTQPYYANSTSDGTQTIDLSSFLSANSSATAYVKRMTSPYIDTKDSTQCTWAGQSYKTGSAAGTLSIDKLQANGTTVSIRGSEALLIFLQGQPFDLKTNGTTAAGGRGSGSGTSANSRATAFGLSGMMLLAGLASTIALVY